MFPLAELKHQPKGGRGLTLMDLEDGKGAKDALVAVASFTTALQVAGTSLRGGKPREEVLKGAGLEAYVGRRARKGRAVEGLKPQRLSAA